MNSLVSHFVVAVFVAFIHTLIRNATQTLSLIIAQFYEIGDVWVFLKSLQAFRQSHCKNQIK